MPSIEYSGLKVSGGKVFAILTLLGALGSGAWAVFEFWKNYQDLTTKVLEYTAPDLSHYDEQIAVIKSELDKRRFKRTYRRNEVNGRKP